MDYWDLNYNISKNPKKQKKKIMKYKIMINNPV